MTFCRKASRKIIDFETFISEKDKSFSTSKIAQCHGVFDLLHIGHIKHFQLAKQHGDILVVTLTPDRYVNKGPSRPCFTEQLRAEAIASLDCVDYVIINLWPTAIEAIHKIKPNYYIKGSEYRVVENDLTAKIQDEIEAVRSIGGDIAFTDDITFSSSSLINQHFSPFSAEITAVLESFKARYSVANILNYFENAKKLKVLIVGEAIIDIYHFTDVIGKAGKEPTLVAKHNSMETYLGGSLALANHLSDFCETVSCLTYLGENAEYEELIHDGLKSNVKLTSIYKKNSPTIVKRRYLDEYLRQKLFEVYEINDNYFSVNQQQEFLAKLAPLLQDHDLVIVADFGHGLLDDKSIDILIKGANFLAVNAQSNAGNHGFNCISKYTQADYVSIASRELQLNYRQKHLSITEQMQQLMKEFDYKNLMVTNGRKGTYTAKKNAEICEVPAFAKNVVDRIGAGDAVLAITSLLAYQDAPAELIAFVGNVVGAEAVNIMGNKNFIEKVALVKHISHLLK